jgi:hypothetical protein
MLLEEQCIILILTLPIAIHNSQRVAYFKGKAAENALNRAEYQKKHSKVVPITGRDAAAKYLQECLRLGIKPLCP